MMPPAINGRAPARSFGPQGLVDVSLDVAAGSVCALLGRNGAGKTTTVRILTTLLPPTAGAPMSRASTSAARRPWCEPGSA